MQSARSDSTDTGVIPLLQQALAILKSTGAAKGGKATFAAILATEKALTYAFMADQHRMNEAKDA